VHARLRLIHLYAGWFFVVIFLLTGQYMRYVIHDAMEADNILRYSLRANHIYILLLALSHLTLGVYYRANANDRRQKLQLAGSLLLLLSTVSITLAFFLEPKTGPDRPALVISVAVGVIGVGLHLLGARE
jgi:hypothetical protein